MNPNELIGKAEGPLLEFKAADVLAEPREVARHVVAMLNASNGLDVGEIWIGLEDQPSRPADLHGVPSASIEKDRLRNRLLDNVEPTPSNDELRIDVLAVDERVSLLRISVVAQEWRKPFAVVSKGKREYAIRQQDTTRTIDYEKLRELFRANRPEDDAERSARSFVRNWTESTKRHAQLGGCVNVAFAPREKLGTPLTAGERLALLTEPLVSGNRPQGHTFLARAADVVHSADTSQAHTGMGSFGVIRIEDSGRIRASVRLQDLLDPKSLRPGFPQAIHTLALCEYVTSLARLAKACERDERLSWYGAVSVLRPSGWILPPGDPLERDLWLQERRYNATSGADDHIVEPLLFGRGEVAKNPDGCAWRMLAQLFEHFGLGERHLPREFDPRARRLMID